MHLSDPRLAILAHQSQNIPHAVAVYNAQPNMAQALPNQTIQAQSFDFATCQILGAAPDLKTAEAIIVVGTKQREETLAYIAHALKNIPETGQVYVAQANALGAEGLGKTLRKVANTPLEPAFSKHHARLFVLSKNALNQAALETWLAEAEPKRLKGTPYATQAGLFAFNKMDDGTKLLLETLPETLAGVAGDFGCGPGLLSMRLLALDGISEVHAVDNDWRAVQLCHANGAGDERLHTHWADARETVANIPALDIAVVNPPFHDGAGEDKTLGEAIVQTALAQLKKGGVLYVVANNHLPYERVMPNCQTLSTGFGFKVLKCLKV